MRQLLDFRERFGLGARDPALSLRPDVTNHGVYGRIRVLGGDLDRRMAPAKDAEYLVGETLPY